MLAAPFTCSFLEREQEIAPRILTTKRAPVRSRVVAATREMLAAEADAGRLELPLAVDDVADLILRLAESLTDTDISPTASPDLDKARQAIAALLR